MTDLERLHEERIRGVRTLYEFAIEPTDDGAGDVAISYVYEGLTVVLLPTTGDGFLHVEIDSFVDGMAVEPGTASAGGASAVIVRRAPT